MESWHLSINLSAQIAPDYISEYLNFQNFPGGHVPGPPSMWRLGLSLWALTRQYCFSPQYAPPRLTNKKCLGTPLRVVAQSLKPFKLLATCKRTQQLLAMLGQQCWELLRPFSRS